MDPDLINCMILWIHVDKKEKISFLATPSGSKRWERERARHGSKKLGMSPKDHFGDCNMNIKTESPSSTLCRMSWDVSNLIVYRIGHRQQKSVTKKPKSCHPVSLEATDGRNCLSDSSPASWRPHISGWTTTSGLCHFSPSWRLNIGPKGRHREFF